MELKASAEIMLSLRKEIDSTGDSIASDDFSFSEDEALKPVKGHGLGKFFYMDGDQDLISPDPPGPNDRIFRLGWRWIQSWQNGNRTNPNEEGAKAFKLAGYCSGAMQCENCETTVPVPLKLAGKKPIPLERYRDEMLKKRGGKRRNSVPIT